MEVLKFGALWCRECVNMKSTWEEIEKETPKLKTKYYDIDENAEIAKRYKVKYAPVSIFLDKNGKEILRIQGAKSKEDLRKMIKENLDK